MALANLPAERVIGYLGPRGTYTEEIALNLYKGELGRFIPYPSIDAVIRAVESGDVTEGVVPIENSLEGSVNITVDTLAHEVNVYITKEMVQPIRHSLLTGKDTSQIDVIVSKDQALAQCRRYIAQNYPHAQIKTMESTAAAAYLVASGAKNHAAIANLRTKDIYGLKLVATDIQDDPTNSTRFVVVKRQPEKVDAPTGRYKTSIVCQLDGDRPGGLCDILTEFASRNVNLTKIESRPARTGLGMYIFLLDMEGGMHADNIRAALNSVQQKTLWFKNLGTYPVYTV